MDYDVQLKVQAWLDGELPEAEAREIAEWLATDREAAALAGELRNTRQALAGHEAEIRLPESREFFWSKIEREIQRREDLARPTRQESFLARLRRFLSRCGRARRAGVHPDGGSGRPRTGGGG